MVLSSIMNRIELRMRNELDELSTELAGEIQERQAQGDLGRICRKKSLMEAMRWRGMADRKRRA